MKDIKFFSLLILTFFFIFGPVFRPIGAWMDLIFVTSVLLSAYGIFIVRLKVPKYFSTFLVLVIVFFYATISISTYKFIESGEYIREILIPIRIYTTMFGGYTLLYIIRRAYSEQYLPKVLQFIYFSVLIHALIMAYQLYNPQFKDWIYLYTSTGEFTGTYEYNFRMGGLTGNSGDSVLSVIQSLGIIVMPFMYGQMGRVKKSAFFIGGILIFYSILISGRSGIWSTLIFLPVSVYLASAKRGIELWGKFAIRFVVFIGLFSGVLFLFDKAESESPIYYALRRSLDTFLNYRESGKFEDHTVDVLADHLLLPNDLTTFIFGNGEHLVNTQVTRTLNSDIGYIRNIWGFGIFCSMLFWYPIVYYTTLAFKHNRKHKSAALLLSLSLIMLLFHAKESYLYVRMFLSIYSLILFSFYIDTRSKMTN